MRDLLEVGGPSEDDEEPRTPSARRAPSTAALTSIRNCRLCQLGNGLAVPGHGPKDAKLIVVSDYPGAEEEKTLKNMSGPAGQLLRTGIERIVKIDPEEEVYYLNAIRCRPTDMKKVTDKELLMCRNHLMNELRLLEGKVVLIAGRRALESMLGQHKKRMKETMDFELSKLHGQVFPEMGRKLFITWNPAYVRDLMIQHPLTGKDWTPIGGIPDLFKKDMAGLRTLLVEEYPELLLREEE